MTPWGSWLACTAAAMSWEEAPETPMWTAAVELPAGEGQPEDGRHQERGRQAADEDGAIAQPAPELVQRNDADQSRSSFPVSRKKTSSRLGERTSTPVRSTPWRAATRHDRREDGRAVVGRELEVAVHLVDLVDVVELAAGVGQLVELALRRRPGAPCPARRGRAISESAVPSAIRWPSSMMPMRSHSLAASSM